MKNLITQKVGKDAVYFFSKYAEIDSEKTFVVSTTNIFNILNSTIKHDTVINLSRTNDIRYINKFFEAVNSKLTCGGLYIGCLETITSRMHRLPIGKIPVIGTIYFAIEFFFNRISPKTFGLKKIYFLLTRGRNRLLSKAEAMGRLVCCGFEIIDIQPFNNLTYFVVRKVKEPVFDMNPSYAAIYRMPRIGKNGKNIGVYKIRTMHPYAEYLHDYILKNNGYSETGKPAEDFRLTPWGKVIRKYWLDELPQLLNVVRGDMKLVGVRPISHRYSQDIPEDLRKLRLQMKPGCIPPYVSLNRKGCVQDVLQAEREYLEEKIKHPYTTDTKYFFKALFNIVFRNKRSA